MSRRLVSRADRKALRNLHYLETIERKRNTGRILDPLGLPAGSNHEPQPMGINPVLQMLWPLFAQSIHDLIAADNQPTPAKLVDTAWEIANRSIEKMGFRFVYPMVAMVAPPPESQPETQESDKATADADPKLD
jgi:hypothetical protein